VPASWRRKIIHRGGITESPSFRRRYQNRANPQLVSQGRVSSRPPQRQGLCADRDQHWHRCASAPIWRELSPL